MLCEMMKMMRKIMRMVESVIDIFGHCNPNHIFQ